MSTIQDPRETWLASGSLLTVWWRMPLWGRDCLLPSSSSVALLPLCLRCGEGLVHSQLALLWCSLNPLFSEPARLCLRIELFRGKFSLSRFFPHLSLAIPQFGLLFHISSFRLSSGHSGPILTISMQPVPPPLTGNGRKCLSYFSSGSCG